MHQTAATPRVGHIGFLNCLPLYWGLDATGALETMRLASDTPDKLSDALVAGDLDIGPISVAEYLRHSSELVLLPDLAVGAEGAVLSVVLASRLSPEELDGRVVALGTTSRTSVLLARLLLAQRYGQQPRYVNCVPDLRSMLEVADAGVLIGDPALRVTVAAETGGLTNCRAWDLGRMWYEWTALPMVFAVWAVRRDFLRTNLEEVRAVHRAFLRSRDESDSRIGQIAQEVAAGRHGGAGADMASGTLLRYFERLDFSFGPRQQAGLHEFIRRVAPLAGTPADVELEFVPLQ